MIPRRICASALAALAAACNTRVDAANPYDPQAPVGVQVKGKLSGTVTAQAAFLPSDLTIAVDGVASGGMSVSDVLVQKTAGTSGVAFTAEVPAGTYHISIHVPTFQPVDRYGVPVGVGGKQD